MWRGDGRELYYWHGEELVAVPLSASGDPTGQQVVLFQARYQNNLNTMHDVSPDGQQFVIVEHQAERHHR